MAAELRGEDDEGQGRILLGSTNEPKDVQSVAVIQMHYVEVEGQTA